MREWRLSSSLPCTCIHAPVYLGCLHPSPPPLISLHLFLFPCRAIDISRIVLFGRSLGGAVAFSVVAHTQHAVEAWKGPGGGDTASDVSSPRSGRSGKRNVMDTVEGSDSESEDLRVVTVRGVIVENTFTSISDMIDQLFPFMSRIKWLVQRLYWPSIERVARIPVPLLFVSGAMDGVIPPVHMQRLHDAAVEASSRYLYSIPSAGHNDCWQKGGLEYYNTFSRFLTRATGVGVSKRVQSGEASGWSEGTPTPGWEAPAAVVPIPSTVAAGLSEMAAQIAGVPSGSGVASESGSRSTLDVGAETRAVQRAGLGTGARAEASEEEGVEGGGTSKVRHRASHRSDARNTAKVDAGGRVELEGLSGEYSGRQKLA
jgi:fermentation-respiration switch protein FrsA (DUF1100 family)